MSTQLAAAIALEALYQRFVRERPAGASFPQDRYAVVELLRMEGADFTRWLTAAGCCGRVEYFWK